MHERAHSDRFHRKLLMNGSEAVYPRTKSGSTSLSLFEYFISSFSFYTREFSYCITFRFKMLPSKDLFFSWDTQQTRVSKYSRAWQEPSDLSAGLAHSLLWLLRAGSVLDARIYYPAVH